LDVKLLAQTVLTGHNADRVMANELNPTTDPGEPTAYQIRIAGHLGRQWADWFEGLTITLEDNGETLLTGPVVDQAALHGVLKKVRDLGMPLLSVVSVKPGRASASDAKSTALADSQQCGGNA
jgi:hypothetical protein